MGLQKSVLGLRRCSWGMIFIQLTMLGSPRCCDLLLFNFRSYAYYVWGLLIAANRKSRSYSLGFTPWKHYVTLSKSRPFETYQVPRKQILSSLHFCPIYASALHQPVFFKPRPAISAVRHERTLQVPSKVSELPDVPAAEGREGSRRRRNRELPPCCTGRGGNGHRTCGGFHKQRYPKWMVHTGFFWGVPLF